MILNNEFTTFAQQLADVAGNIIRPYFEAELLVEDKADKTPVTKADREAEAAMRALIERTYPDHAIFGEEYGVSLNHRSEIPPPSRGRSGGGASLSGAHPHRPLTHPSPARGEGLPNYTWVLDPIDGTKAFLAGRKEWGTLIALCADGVPILGILDQPVTGERWIGVRGEPTHYSIVPVQATDPRLRGKEATLQTRACATLAEAELSTTSATYFTSEQAKHVVVLAQSVRSTVKDGDCYAYGLLARGLRDLVVDAGLKPYDILALVPIIEGAGGKITGWDGAPITLTHFSTALAAGDPKLLQAARSLLGS